MPLSSTVGVNVCNTPCHVEASSLADADPVQQAPVRLVVHAGLGRYWHRHALLLPLPGSISVHAKRAKEGTEQTDAVYDARYKEDPDHKSSTLFIKCIETNTLCLAHGGQGYHGPIHVVLIFLIGTANIIN